MPPEIVPNALFPPGTPATLHVTAVFALLATAAVNVIVFPSNTGSFEGVIVTPTGSGGGGVVDAVAVVPAAEVRPQPLPTVARNSSKRKNDAPAVPVEQCA